MRRASTRRQGHPAPRRRLAAAGVLAVLAGALVACGGQQDGGISVTGDDVDTHQTVEAGQSVRITARGTLDFGGGVAGFGALRLSADGEDGSTPPDSPAPHLRRNSLVVRIGNTYYQGGVDTTIVAATAGDIVLRANDPTPPTGAAGWDVRLDLGDRATTGGSPDDSGSVPPAGFDQLPVNGPMVWTDVFVAAGSTVHLTASGVVDFGRAPTDDVSPRLDADGSDGPAPAASPAPNLRPNSLVVQIGGSPSWYQGGSDVTFVPTTSGALGLAANDDDVRNNTQSWFVSARVTAPPGGAAVAPAFGPFVISNTTVDTGLTVTAGQRLHIEARGRMNLGGAAIGNGDVIDDANGDNGPTDGPTPPDYPAPQLKKNSLVVRIGTVSYQGGRSVDITARTGGSVSLLPNDVLPEDNRSVFNEGVRGWSVMVMRR